MPPTGSATSVKKAPSLRALHTKLKGLQTSLNNIVKFVQCCDENTTASQVSVRLERLDELWEKIGETIYEIESHDDFEAGEEAFSKERVNFEDRYYDVKSALMDKARELQDAPVLEQSVRQTDTNQHASMDHVRLPQIQLQTFDGNIDEWFSFRDLFTSLIHWKTELPEVEKFHYLKGCLEGEAKALIDPLKITKGNYQIAWDLLVKRYNNSKLLKKRQVQALFKLPVLAKESSTELHKLLEGFDRIIQTLDQVVQPVDYKDLLLVDVLSSRLDPYTRRGWEELSSDKDQDTLKDLTEFLQRRIRILESLPAKPSEGRSDSVMAQRKKPFAVRTSHSASQSSAGKCIACSDSHWLHVCPSFQRMSVGSKESFLRSHSLCRNCFRKGHQAKDCSSKFSCRSCKGRHHTMVCFKPDDENGNKASSGEGKASTSTQDGKVASVVATDVVTSNMAHQRASKVLLATAVVLVEDDDGKRHPARALLDSGSECNFVSERLCKLMNISKDGVDVSVVGIGQASTRVRHQIHTTIRSRSSSFVCSMTLLVLPKVTANLPTTTVSTRGWDIPEGIILADPAFYQTNSVDLIFGIQSFFGFFRTGKAIPLGDGLPLLTESVFGWVVSGEVSSPTQSSQISCNMVVSDNLEELMERFWSCEEVGDSCNYSPEEARCEEQFGRTVQRGLDGRYTVTLPKNGEFISKLGDSKDIALRRFQGLERRLGRDQDLRKQYQAFMAEYLELGHMRKVADDTCVKRYFLPHHPVVKEASTTTKVRVVFDASCKTSTGISVNDALLAGPVIQQDLRSIMLRCRTRQVMIVADVEKMFRQVKMAQNDTTFQNILWRFDMEAEVETYELTTVTYGTKPAPFLATRTLKQLALDEGSSFPLAAKAMEEDVYMDDVITGTDDVNVAIELRKQLDAIMASGGFRLRKWASNNQTVLDGIPQADLALPMVDGISWDQDQMVKTLGLTWLPKMDTLRFNFDIPALLPDQLLTKRKILSIIASLFDPLGLIGATITIAKIFMQRLWSMRDAQGNALNWDCPIPETVGEEWRKFHQQLPSLNNLRIKRCVIAPRAVSTQIHCFCDASERAYGACVYLRTFRDNGEITVRLLTSKSKVAPLKTQSLPRLELCGALLAAQLWEWVSNSIGLTHEVHFWTDSTCVLQWIKAPSNTWTTFVANRVSKIQTLTENYIWRHVPGVSNPADLISRGVPPDQIHGSSMWWEGSSWLKESADRWPRSLDTVMDEVPERRRNAVACVSTEKSNFMNKYLSNFSSYTNLLRTTAYWLRLIRILRKTEGEEARSFLTSTELREAEFVIVRMVQQDMFSEELKGLTSGKGVPRNSPLRWYKPIISENGVLRVGGRLGHSQQPNDVKHPMVLSARHTLTEMILRHYHQQLLHAGPQLLLSTIRLRFWPLGGRNLARKVVHQCHRCFRAKPTLLKQQMGELPAPRVTRSRPFSRCGVDYFGPVYTRAGRRLSATKSYVAIFVCMSTKAVHMEHVTDLSTERFLQALRRFFARRGRSSDMYSDNGTNFVGAKNQLRELFTLLKDSRHQQAVTKECATNGIQWHFNPPAAPHFGGLWEAAVRSAKYHLLRVLGGNPVSAEDFITLLAQVEACLNSRPLTPMSDDPTDLEPLTPAHFLIGGSLQAIPEPDYGCVQLNRLTRWQLVQRQLQDFWRRWKMEYLSQLQSRTKNWGPSLKIDVDRLVVIVDANQPPMRWKLGRIDELHPGQDGVVRVVTVKTATGRLTRPVEKLCLLPRIEERMEDTPQAVITPA
ncbi:uncharacterized protein LOC131687034 [Topomyia yanbarensis]|uniref:uncharacterized protein LOC131687034 n=1 Tax=Topomyia yanbarensis TaxID=2498891 RepID=UPI00273C0456|nr:uncharacterized protein LOC131687034 [Topomyia yanbarensis]